MIARALVTACLMLIGLAHVELAGAEDIARLQAGVVKVTAKPPSGTANVGTGFIVRVDKDAAYIVTAAHVVAGDTHPKVEFFTKRNLPVTAEVLGLEGDDEVRGLALLVVRGSENLSKGLTSLSLAGAARLTGGEDILVIGFPRNAGPWAIVKGNISSRQGRDIYFSPSIESGHSGGPIFQGGKVVGVVGSGIQSVGRGVTVGSVEDYIEGFGITAQESMVSTTPAVSAKQDNLATPAVGRALFQGKGVCFECHGKTGKGDGQAASILNPRPTDLTNRRSLKYRTDKERFNVMKYGIPGTGMVAMSQLSDEELWLLVAYLKQLAE